MAKQISKIFDIKLLSGKNGFDLRLLTFNCLLADSDGYSKKYQKVVAVKNLTTEQKAGLLNLWRTMKSTVESLEGLDVISDPIIDTEDAGF